MRMQGLVVDAQIGSFQNSVELTVVDTSVSPGRKRKTFTVKIYDGLPGLSDLQTLSRRQKADPHSVDPAQVQQLLAVLGPSLPQFQSTVDLEIYDVTGSGKYVSLVGQLV